MQLISLLGSTGSIGQQTLDVVAHHPDLFKILAIAALDEVELLCEQVHRFNPAYVVVYDDSKYQELKERIPDSVQILTGQEGLCQIAALDQADIVVVAVSGAVGILPTISAARAGKRIALANKETLVAAGDIVMPVCEDSGSELIPVDSEHSAIFQCLRDEHQSLHQIWLTASGGPFRSYSREQLEQVTLEMALQHPNWSMGPKITVDSASMMNKGLEVIEAHHLFQVDYDRIKVLIHPQSIVHSMVEYVDGSWLAHLGVPDMRIPIQYALTYPMRFATPTKRLDLIALQDLHFEQPDLERFPSLRLAYEAGEMGGTMPAVLNAANEVAVHHFLSGHIKFIDIPDIVSHVMSRHQAKVVRTVNDILQCDQNARELTRERIAKGG
jgi:1-deoxy-D-xylulose-5-phosphate reductoisomerase